MLFIQLLMLVAFDSRHDERLLSLIDQVLIRNHLLLQFCKPVLFLTNCGQVTIDEKVDVGLPLHMIGH